MMRPTPAFDPRTFLAHVGDDRSAGRYRKGQFVFSQGDPADAVFDIQRRKISSTARCVMGRSRDLPRDVAAQN
jgi:CRP/FNR family cyclic AMP-dependent transcriptional regulator